MSASPPFSAVFITGHHVASLRRAGFHWIADSFYRRGARVTFATVAISRISRLKKDHRLTGGDGKTLNRLLPGDGRPDGFVWFTPFHPFSLRREWLNRLAGPVFRAFYPLFPLRDLRERLRTADLVVFESCVGIMLFDRIRRLNSRARMVYRVSDDLRTVNAPEWLLDVEERLAPQFDLISSPSAAVHAKFKGLPSAACHHHGIRKEIFDSDLPDPYQGRPGRHAIFVGVQRLDVKFILDAADTSPGWQFHLVGPLPDIPARPNIHVYGERPFTETVGFIKHADAGIAAYPNTGLESLTDSLKIIQYTYARLPVLVPDFLADPARPHLITYIPGDADSCRRAMQAAEQFDRSRIDNAHIRGWDELADMLAGESLAARLSRYTTVSTRRQEKS